MLISAYEKNKRAFEKFDRENPDVKKHFDGFVFDRLSRGWTRFSADAIMHRVRWETNVNPNYHDFKIANAHVAFYARRFMVENPQHKGFFRLGEQTSKNRMVNV